MDCLNKSQILQADDLDRKEVECPEWGGSVFVRKMNTEEMMKVGAMGTKTKATGDLDATMYQLIATWVIVDEGGKSIFAATEIDKVAKKSFDPIRRIVETCMEMSGMTEEAAEEAGKDLEKMLPAASSSS